MTSTPKNANSSRKADADNSRFHAAPLRSRGRHSTADRILSAGLATAACIGVVGVLGARTMETGTAAQQEATASTAAGSATLAVSSTGLTEQQLDAYAVQLQQESAKLDAYRAQLATLAASLKASGSSSSTAAAAQPSVASVVPTVKKPKPKPKPKAAPAPAPSKPQATTKSS